MAKRPSIEDVATSPAGWRSPEPAYTPPAGHAKHLSDSERAHNGEPGSKVRHGADATGGIPMRNMRDFDKL